MEFRVSFRASAVIEVPEGVEIDYFLNTEEGWELAFNEAMENGFECDWREY